MATRDRLNEIYTIVTCNRLRFITKTFFIYLPTNIGFQCDFIGDETKLYIVAHNIFLDKKNATRQSTSSPILTLLN